MGVEYEILDLKHKTKFDLGKGPWLKLWELLDKYHPLYHVEPEFDRMVPVCLRYWSGSKDPHLDEYCKGLMNEIRQFWRDAGGEVRMYCDASPDLSPEWPVVASRYK